MKFSKLVEFVSKKAIPPHTKHLITEVMVSDEEGEDVEVSIHASTVRLWLLMAVARFLSLWSISEHGQEKCTNRNQCSISAYKYK